MGPVKKCVKVNVVNVVCAGWDISSCYCDGSLLGIYCNCKHVCMEVIV